MPSDVEPGCDDRIEQLGLQIEANARVLGLILLLLSGYPFPRALIEEVAHACGICPPYVDEPPAQRSH